MRTRVGIGSWGTTLLLKGKVLTIERTALVVMAGGRRTIRTDIMRSLQTVSCTPALLGATTGSVLFLNGGGDRAALAPSLGILEVAVFEEVEGVGAPGGFGIAGSWGTRQLDTVRVSSGASISLNPTTAVITLQPGIYHVEASAPAYFVNGHRIRLENISIGSTALLGTSEWTQNGGSQVQTRSFIDGYVRVIGGPDDFELQHLIEASTDGTSLGQPCNAPGTPEVYATMSITRIR